MVYLTDLADVLRTTGRKVVELPGWKSNTHPGSFDPQGNLWHHTGSYDALTDATNDYDYARWLAFQGRSDLPGPLCNVSISAEGVYYLCAAGRAYHAGTARASGPVPSGNGNGLYIGWECMNSGSQGWGREQYDAMVAGAVVTSKHYGWSAAANRAHRETSITGKWDPGLLDMDKFRRDIANHQEDDMAQYETLLKEIKDQVINARDWAWKANKRAERVGTTSFNRDQRMLAAIAAVAEIADGGATKGQVAKVRGDIARLAEEVAAENPDEGEEA